MKGLSPRDTRSPVGVTQSPAPLRDVVSQILRLCCGLASARTARELPTLRRAMLCLAKHREWMPGPVVNAVFLFSVWGYNRCPNTQQIGTEKPWVDDYSSTNERVHKPAEAQIMWKHTLKSKGKWALSPRAVTLKGCP